MVWLQPKPKPFASLLKQLRARGRYPVSGEVRHRAPPGYRHWSTVVLLSRCRRSVVTDPRQPLCPHHHHHVPCNATAVQGSRAVQEGQMVISAASTQRQQRAHLRRVPTPLLSSPPPVKPHLHSRSLHVSAATAITLKIASCGRELGVRGRVRFRSCGCRLVGCVRSGSCDPGFRPLLGGRGSGNCKGTCNGMVLWLKKWASYAMRGGGVHSCELGARAQTLARNVSATSRRRVLHSLRCMLSVLPRPSTLPEH